MLGIIYQFGRRRSNYIVSADHVELIIIISVVLHIDLTYASMQGNAHRYVMLRFENQYVKNILKYRRSQEMIDGQPLHSSRLDAEYKTQTQPL